MISDRFQTLFSNSCARNCQTTNMRSKKTQQPHKPQICNLPSASCYFASFAHQRRFPGTSHTNWTNAFAKQRLSCFAKPTSRLASNLWQTSERANACRQAQNRLSWLPKPTYQLASHLKQTSEYANMLWPGGVRAARFNKIKNKKRKNGADLQAAGGV